LAIYAPGSPCTGPWNKIGGSADKYGHSGARPRLHTAANSMLRVHATSDIDKTLPSAAAMPVSRTETDVACKSRCEDHRMTQSNLLEAIQIEIEHELARRGNGLAPAVASGARAEANFNEKERAAIEEDHAFVVEAQKPGNVVSSDRMEKLTARYLPHSL